MTKEAVTKIQAYKSRHTIYLQKEFVTDSMFPFKVGEELVVTIDKDVLTVKRRKPSNRS